MLCLGRPNRSSRRSSRFVPLGTGHLQGTQLEGRALAAPIIWRHVYIPGNINSNSVDANTDLGDSGWQESLALLAILVEAEIPD